MPVLKFGEYRPDASDLNSGHSQNVLNVLPRSDGYGPVRTPQTFTFDLPAVCRGYFYARRTDGSVTIFAGTETRLYKLDNATLDWTDVSQGGSAYTALSTNANWQFAQFNNIVIAVQANEPPQKFNVESDSAFSDLGGTPPQAAYVTVVNRFVVLSGLADYPKRVQWSGLNAIETWTSGTTFSDYQDLPDGGNVKGVVGGEFGIIIQDLAVRRMTFVPGSDVIFDIDRIAKDVGATAPYGIVDANGVVMFLSTKGFVKIDAGGTIVPIGTERIDRTFLESYDENNIQLVIGCADPTANVVIWSYKEIDFSPTRFNKLLAYNWVLDRWSPIEIEGEYLASMAQPGITLEGLGTIGSVAVSGAANNGSGLVRLTVASTTGWATGDIKQVASVGGTTEANGEWTITVINGTTIDLQGSTYANAYTSGGYVEGSIDDLEISFDDLSASTLPKISICNSDHRICFFTGDNMEATLDAAEQSSISKRLFVRGGYPVSDTDDAYMSIGARENMQGAASFSTEQQINAQGFCPARVSTRHARPRLRIPEGSTWTFATGIEPDYTQEGRR